MTRAKRPGLYLPGLSGAPQVQVGPSSGGLPRPPRPLDHLDRDDYDHHPAGRPLPRPARPQRRAVTQATTTTSAVPATTPGSQATTTTSEDAI